MHTALWSRTALEKNFHRIINPATYALLFKYNEKIFLCGGPSVCNMVNPSDDAFSVLKGGGKCDNCGNYIRNIMFEHRCPHCGIEIGMVDDAYEA